MSHLIAEASTGEKITVGLSAPLQKIYPTYNFIQI
jgi:hypothetical protein